MPRPWFENENYSTVTITRFTSISKHTVEQSIHIDDTDLAKRLKERINAIPAEGDMMISFGPDAEHVSLSFEGDGFVQTIHFYSGKIKTPSTGFNSNKTQAELNVYRDIDALLYPSINKQMLKIKDLEIQFPIFSITYLGNTFKDEAPVTLSFTTDRYVIRDKKGDEQFVEISSGQLPPQPFDFNIGKKSFVLNTFESNSGGRLYTDYFQILNG